MRHNQSTLQNLTIGELQRESANGDESCLMELGRRVLDMDLCYQSHECNHIHELSNLEAQIENESPLECSRCHHHSIDKYGKKYTLEWVLTEDDFPEIDINTGLSKPVLVKNENGDFIVCQCKKGNIENEYLWIIQLDSFVHDHIDSSLEIKINIFSWRYLSHQ